jgi:hypothetical protein
MAIDTQPVMEPAVIEQEWVYLGQGLTTKNKIVHRWARADKEIVAYTKLVASVVGGHYRIKMTHDGSVYHGGASAPRYLRPDPDREWVTGLELEDRQVKTLMESSRRAKAMDTELDKALAPIRQKYKSTIGSAARAALLALVIQRITG